MEKVRVQCAACGAAFATGAEHAGKSGKCPKCGGAVQVPAARSAPAAKPGWDSEEPEELDDSDADVVIRDRPSARREEPARPQRVGLALAATTGAAAIGSLGWAALLVIGDVEIGWAAWGIGALVGAAGMLFARGNQLVAVGAALLTLLSIFGGKLAGYQFQTNKVRKEISAQQAEQQAQLFPAYQQDAEEWAELSSAGKPSPDDLRTFVFEHDYSPMESPDQIRQQDLDAFLTHIAPRLEWIQAEEPTHAQFRERVALELEERIAAEQKPLDLVLEDLNGIDLIFGLLGITTAYGLVSKGWNRERRGRRRR